MYIPSKMTKLRQAMRAQMRVVNPRFVTMAHEEMNRITKILQLNQWPMQNMPRLVVNKEPQMAAIVFVPKDQISVNFPQIKIADQIAVEMQSAMALFALESLYQRDMDIFNNLHSARGEPKPVRQVFGSPRFQELIAMFA